MDCRVQVETYQMKFQAGNADIHKVFMCVLCAGKCRVVNVGRTNYCGEKYWGGQMWEGQIMFERGTWDWLCFNRMV